MDRIAVTEDGSLERRDDQRPSPGIGEVLVRTLSVGIDGTDHEVIEGGHGGFPEGDDHLVLGHEAVGVIEDANGTRFDEGDVVVPTVRRISTEEGRPYFIRDEPDMAPFQEVHERGISGAHGFMAEYFTSDARYLVRVPDEKAEYGHFIEPMSITEKAIEHAYASRSAFDWTPESLLVLGDGRLGLLTVAALAPEYDRVYCLGLSESPDPRVDIVERLGATYINSNETPLPDVSEEYEEMDLIIEGTGHAPHPFQSIRALAPNGVTVTLGVPGGSHQFDLDGGELQTEMVLHNKALIGSVNAGHEHFEAAIDRLDAIPEWFFDEYVTTSASMDNYRDAFNTGESDIKTVLEF